MFGWALTAGILAACVAFSFRYSNPETPKWLAIGVMGISCMLAVAWSAMCSRAWKLDAVDLTVLAMLVYAAMAASWSLDQPTSVVFLAKFLLLGSIFVYYRHWASPHVAALACFAVMAASALALAFAIRWPEAWGGFNNRNYITEFLLASLPCALALWVWKGWLPRAAALMVAGAVLWYLLAENPSKIEFLVLPGAAAVMFMISRAPTWTKVLGTGAAVLAALAVVILGWDYLLQGKGFGDSARIRAGFYYQAFLAWLDAPLLGHGPGSFPAVQPWYREQRLGAFTRPEDLWFDAAASPGPAHNDLLQLGVEQGVVGLALGLLALGLLARGFAPPAAERYAAWAGAGMVAATLPNMLVNFPLQNPATALVAALGCALMARPRSDRRILQIPAPRPLRMGVLAMAFAAAIGILTWLPAFERAERQLLEATGPTLEFSPERSFRVLDTAAREYPLMREVLMQRHVSLVSWFDEDAGLPVMAHEFDRVFGAAVSVAPYLPAIRTTRLEYLIASGRYETRGQEIDEHFRILSQNAKLSPDVHLLEAVYALLVGDTKRARAAIAAGRAVLEGMRRAADSIVERNRLAAASIGRGSARRAIADPAGAAFLRGEARRLEIEFDRLQSVAGGH